MVLELRGTGRLLLPLSTTTSLGCFVLMEERLFSDLDDSLRGAAGGESGEGIMSVSYSYWWTEARRDDDDFFLDVFITVLMGLEGSGGDGAAVDRA